MNKLITEDFVKKSFKKQYSSKGKVKIRLGHEGGIDIEFSDYVQNRKWIIEAKGEVKNNSFQNRNNALHSVIGEIVLRMHKSSIYKKYAIVIPSTWEDYLRKNVRRHYSWKLLKLHVFLVDSGGKVVKKDWRSFY